MSENAGTPVVDEALRFVKGVTFTSIRERLTDADLEEVSGVSVPSGTAYIVKTARRLEQERNALRAMIDDAPVVTCDDMENVADLKRENARLREALQTVLSTSNEICQANHENRCAYTGAGEIGDVARQALSAPEGGGR